MILDAWGWCTGTTQRDGMGRDEGGGFRMGNIPFQVLNSHTYLLATVLASTDTEQFDDNGIFCGAELI